MRFIMNFHPGHQKNKTPDDRNSQPRWCPKIASSQRPHRHSVSSASCGSPEELGNSNMLNKKTVWISKVYQEMLNTVLRIYKIGVIPNHWRSSFVQTTVH